MAHLEDLESAVNSNRDVVNSAVTLIQGIADKLEEVKDDPAKIQALANDLRSQQQALADAVAANTPSEGTTSTTTTPEF